MVRVAHDVVGGAFGYKMKEDEHPSGLINIWDFIGGLANLCSLLFKWQMALWIHLAIMDMQKRGTFNECVHDGLSLAW